MNINNINQKCEECGELLKLSQYARAIREDEILSKATDHLVCRNYPKCSKSEVE